MMMLQLLLLDFPWNTVCFQPFPTRRRRGSLNFNDDCFQVFHSNKHVPDLVPEDGSSDEESSLSLDPWSDAAHSLVVNNLGINERQYEKLAELSSLVVDWNERINLVSRKDCNAATVFGRHVLPCLATATRQDSPLETAETVVDVGTGGGFPGLPLAILYPTVRFVLLDSVGKKLTAVQDMADRLELPNVQVHHGRAEDLQHQVFDLVTGRSVSDLYKFCAWTHHLLKPSSGHLMYWIGGDLPENVLALTVHEWALQDLLPQVESDKRILVFPATAVSQLARESGIKVRRQNVSKRTQKDATPKQSKRKSRGAWKKKNRNEKQELDYEGFKRYSSTNKIESKDDAVD